MSNVQNKSKMLLKQSNYDERTPKQILKLCAAENVHTGLYRK